MTIERSAKKQKNNLNVNGCANLENIYTIYIYTLLLRLALTGVVKLRALDS